MYAAVLREAGVPPTSVWMKLNNERAKARWVTLPKEHPVVEGLTPASPPAQSPQIPRRHTHTAITEGRGLKHPTQTGLAC